MGRPCSASPLPHARGGAVQHARPGAPCGERVSCLCRCLGHRPASSSVWVLSPSPACQAQAQAQAQLKALPEAGWAVETEARRAAPWPTPESSVAPHTAAGPTTATSLGLPISQGCAAR